MLRLFLLTLFCSIIIESSHFNGGTITWTPVDPYTNASTVVITITQTYSWVLSKVVCDVNVPISTSSRTDENVNLTCISGCSTQGNYQSSPIDILTDCVSTSTSLDMMKSQRSKNVTLSKDAYFTIAYQDSAWRSLENNNNNDDDWSITCVIDLRERPDGIINTPPVATVASPQYVIVNKTTQIKIPVSDVNTGDDIRYRWSTDSGSVDECGSVCYSNKLPKNTTITDCILTFTGTEANTWFAIALQVEDFFNTTSTTPMSSTSVQFLIYVLPLPSCSQLPVILPLTYCFEIQVGIPINLTLYAMNYCNRTKTIITDISLSMDISNISVSPLYNSKTPSIQHGFYHRNSFHNPLLNNTIERQSVSTVNSKRIHNNHSIKLSLGDKQFEQVKSASNRSSLKTKLSSPSTVKSFRIRRSSVVVHPSEKLPTNIYTKQNEHLNNSIYLQNIVISNQTKSIDEIPKPTKNADNVIKTRNQRKRTNSFSSVTVSKVKKNNTPKSIRLNNSAI